MLNSTLLFLFLLTPLAHAKSSSWWDCFFREFELCQGRTSDPESPDSTGVPKAGGEKVFCDGKARANCDEEERQKTVKLDGRSANDRKGKSTITDSKPDAKPSRIEDSIAVPSSVIVEGKSPSGDNTVLGVDVTLPISGVAEAYKGRNAHGCRPIDDAFTRVLCLDAPGAGGGAPVELEFYRGRLVSLNYETHSDSAVKFRAAVSVAEEKTGAKAMISSSIQDPTKYFASELRSRFCMARFPLGGGTLTLHGLPSDEKGAEDACAPLKLDSASLVRVEWAPPGAVMREVDEQRKSDLRPTQQRQKREEVEKTRTLLPL